MNVGFGLSFEQHGNIVGGELEAAAIGDTLDGDGIFRSSWINAGDPETLATSDKLAFEVSSLQAVLFGQQGEHLLIQIEWLAVWRGNTDAECWFE